MPPILGGKSLVTSSEVTTRRDRHEPGLGLGDLQPARRRVERDRVLLAHARVGAAPQQREPGERAHGAGDEPAAVAGDVDHRAAR